MKAQLFVLAAAGLLVTAAHAFAADREVDAFAGHAQAVAKAKLSAAGVALAGPVTVQGRIAPEGLIQGLHVVSSSGSRDADYAVERALKRLNVGEAPTPLVGAELTLTLGGTGSDTAQAR